MGYKSDKKFPEISDSSKLTFCHVDPKLGKPCSRHFHAPVSSGDIDFEEFSDDPFFTPSVTVGEEMVEVKTKPCSLCGKESIVEVPKAGFDAYKAGAHVQNAFPHLHANVREMLISGTHPECWDKMFPPEDDWEFESESRLNQI